MNFHNKRIIFMIDDDTIHVAKNGMTHETWAKKLGIFAKYKTMPRGFFWPPTNSLYFYYGYDFTDHHAVADDMRDCILDLLPKVRGNNDTIIHGGMVPGQEGEMWTPCHIYGTIYDFLDIPTSLRDCG